MANVQGFEIIIDETVALQKFLINFIFVIFVKYPIRSFLTCEFEIYDKANTFKK